MNSINLLPTTRRRVIAFNRHAGKARLVFVSLVVALSATYGVALAQRIRLQGKTNDAKVQINKKSPEVERYDAVAAQAKELSSKAKEYADVVSQDRDWGQLFVLFQQALPPNAHIVSLTTSSSGQVTVVSLAGSASDQKAVGVFREKLLATPKTNPDLHIDVSDATIDSITATGNDSAAQNFTMRVTVTLQPANGK